MAHIGLQPCCYWTATLTQGRTTQSTGHGAAEELTESQYAAGQPVNSLPGLIKLNFTVAWCIILPKALGQGTGQASFVQHRVYWLFPKCYKRCCKVNMNVHPCATDAAQKVTKITILSNFLCCTCCIWLMVLVHFVRFLSL